MAGTWKSGFYYGSIKDGFTKLAPFGPGVSAKTKALIATKEKMIENGSFYEFAGPIYDQSGKLRVAEGQAADDPAALLGELARQGRDRQPEGLARPRRSGNERSTPRPPRRGRPWRCAGSRSASPACVANDRRRLRGGRGRGARAARRERRRQEHALEHPDRPLPARRGRDRALRASRCEFAIAARRARRRHRHGAPALSARRAVHRRRERRARRPRGDGRGRSGSSRAGSSATVAELSAALRPRRSTRGRAIWQLSVGEQQRVEILKALYRDARILILDEPTAVLTPQEADGLFATLRADGRRRAHGDLHLAQAERGDGRLRPGHRAARRPLDRDGRDRRGDDPRRSPRSWSAASSTSGAAAAAGPSPASRCSSSTTLWAAGEPRRPTRCRGVSLAVRAGEIVGVAGVAGNGQRELAETIAGLRRPTRGSMRVAGQPLTRRRSAGGARGRDRLRPRGPARDRASRRASASPPTSCLRSYREPAVSRGPLLRLDADPRSAPSS